MVEPELIVAFMADDDELPVKSTVPPLQTPATLAEAVGVGLGYTVAVIAVLEAGHPEEAA
jgi:hypothetical protein